MSTRGKTKRRFDLSTAQGLYTNGATCQQIADLMGLSRSYVSTRLRNAGTGMRAPGRPVTPVRIDVDALVRLRNVGATWTELATIFELTRYALQSIYNQASR